MPTPVLPALSLPPTSSSPLALVVAAALLALTNCSAGSGGASHEDPCEQLASECHGMPSAEATACHNIGHDGEVEACSMALESCLETCRNTSTTTDTDTTSDGSNGSSSDGTAGSSSAATSDTTGTAGSAGSAGTSGATSGGTDGSTGGGTTAGTTSGGTTGAAPGAACKYLDETCVGDSGCQDIGNAGNDATCIASLADCIPKCGDTVCDFIGTFCHDADPACHDIGHDGSADQCDAALTDCAEKCN